jgi:hypothetical protein
MPVKLGDFIRLRRKTPPLEDPALGAAGSFISNFGYWNFNKSMKFQQSTSPPGIIKAWSYLRVAGPVGRRPGQGVYIVTLGSRWYE